MLKVEIGNSMAFWGALLTHTISKTASAHANILIITQIRNFGTFDEKKCPSEPLGAWFGPLVSFAAPNEGTRPPKNTRRAN
jgi:hypothetical protein